VHAEPPPPPPPPPRPRWRRAARPLAVLLPAVLLAAGALAGCGSGSPAVSPHRPGPPAARLRPPALREPSSAQTRAYARCMRSHGEPDWPDPGSGGEFTLTAAAATPQWVAADAVCQPLLGLPAALTATLEEQVITRVLGFAACLRSHGITAVPPPVFRDGGVTLTVPDAVARTARFRAARPACQQARAPA